MTRIDLDDPQARAWAISIGLIWSAPQGAIVAALYDIAEGRVPEPDDVPMEWRPALHAVRREVALRGTVEVNGVDDDGI